MAQNMSGYFWLGVASKFPEFSFFQYEVRQKSLMFNGNEILLQLFALLVSLVASKSMVHILKQECFVGIP
ncbi:hypothetical protein M2459_003405 [Parabacteroides sp. PF5-5]|uniref:hypothetical protein n=1 Tax=unclassified Parabacteroides TaxID=2649774 RepID=UPI002472F370|nr:MULTISPECIES: hypothetical protein [unclassified Parabacteroides]MDH6306759.1 hypothetical protein [Parabacteroides sp. PH5-39]MDH6317645.1 hypothetical protein [Parabacteroides sp. PF5-13]MDH6321471.1 hypothetical protein [Parabacteroides sp. PH5-13]MDH6325252.1 hypothetical protein [Parabacteroides sp. PH5-8]MDH6328830.1 hypothetical protein [Parabacteroides sp. PH5-41]